MDATWYGGRPRPRQQCVRCGPSSTPQGAQLHPQISAHVYCGQTAGWIKMPLATKVGLGPGRIVLHGDPDPPPKRGTIGKNLLNSNISSTCPHNMVNFGLLAAEIISLVCGNPANFNRFRVLASLLQRHCSTEANQTLQDVWLFPGLVHYIYIFRSCCPVTQFCQL